MKNQDIITAFEGLSNLRQAATQSLPARISFTIIRNLKTLQPIVEDIQMTYNSLLQKYADPIEGEDNQYQVKDGFIDTFTKEVNDLYDYDTEVSITKLKFSDIENLNFTLSEIDSLYFMIEDGET